ncbi:MAG: M20/M25/M40 family metallo-hydrolase, partial [Planctomycetota bacterium]
NARDHGAAGIIFVSGPTSKVRNQLVRFERDASQSGISIPVISINNRLAVRLMQAAERDLGKEQSKIDDGEMAMGFLLEGATVSANIAIERKTGTGRNVIGRLPANDAPMGANPVVMVGAHIDHLGVGGGSSSLARDEERDRVHVGADDNASGVAAMLEIAQGLAQDIRQGTIQPKRDLVVAAWSGEELGLYGSKAFVGEYLDRYPRSIDLMMGIRPQEDAGSQPESPADDATSLEPNAASPEPGAAPPIANESGLTVGDIVAAHGMDPDALPLTGLVSAYLNLDMVGRLEEKLIVQGTGSSPAWEPLVQRRNVPVGLQLRLDPSAARLPTDAASFVAREVPILAAFTGVHEDYHTPRDTPEKLNYEGAAKIARLFALIARDVLTSDTPPNFELDEQSADQQQQPSVNLRAYLGTIPDYVKGDIKGVPLSGVSKRGPAAAAGIKGGDVIVKVAGKTIEDVYDYTYAIEALKIGDPIEIVVLRDGKEQKFQVTPGSRD